MAATRSIPRITCRGQDLSAEVQREIRQNGWTMWLTFMVGSASTTVEASERVVKAGWRELSEHLRRSHGPFSYRWLVHNQGGYTHLNVFWSIEMPVEQLRGLWARYTGSDAVQVEPIRSRRRVADYVANIEKVWCREKHGKRTHYSRGVGR